MRAGREVPGQSRIGVGLIWLRGKGGGSPSWKAIVCMHLEEHQQMEKKEKEEDEYNNVGQELKDNEGVRRKRSPKGGPEIVRTEGVNGNSRQKPSQQPRCFTDQTKKKHKMR